jgi:6-phosphogluconolactonase
MIGGEVIYTESQKEFGIIAAQKMVSIISDTIDKNGKCSVAISGGRTPLPVYDILKSKNYHQILDWSKVHMFFTDERCVKKNDRENNFKSCYSSWLQYFPTINSYRIEGWLSLNEAASKYEEKIKSILDLINGHPQFDLIFMGIGEDGHVASLFPEYDFEKNIKNYVEGFYVNKVNMNRITMTLPILNNAKNRLIGIIGKKKKGIFNDLLNYKYKDYPVARLLSSSANDTWVVN